MTFSDGTANALIVSNSAINVTDSMIANLRHTDSAIDIQNRDGSQAFITNCTCTLYISKPSALHLATLKRVIRPKPSMRS